MQYGQYLNNTDQPLEWQVPILRGLAIEAVKRGIRTYNRHTFGELLANLSVAEFGLPPADRVGYHRIANYSDRGITRVIKKVIPFLEEAVRTGAEKLPTPKPLKKTLVHDPLPVVLSVLLDKSTYAIEQLQLGMEKFYRTQFPDCEVLKIRKVHSFGDGWYDLFIDYRIDLGSVADALTHVPFVLGTKIKHCGMFAKKPLRMEFRRS